MTEDEDVLFPQAIPLSPPSFERSPMVHEFVASLSHLPASARDSLLTLTFDARFARQRHQDGFFEGSLSLPHIEELCTILNRLPVNRQAFGILVGTLISNIEPHELVAHAELHLLPEELSLIAQLIDAIYTPVPFVAFMATGRRHLARVRPQIPPTVVRFFKSTLLLTANPSALFESQKEGGRQGLC
jgi:hypothetical protein